MATRESLEKLIEFISELASQNGNVWFAEKLVRKISDLDAQPITRRTLSEVHERCIADIIQSQANGFYSGFSIANIKSCLIEDFIEMERFRREDNFKEFCYKINQQLEAIVNALCTKEMLCNIEDNLDKKVYSYLAQANDEINSEGKPKKEKKVGTLGELIFYNYIGKGQVLDRFGKSRRIEWGFQNKIKALIYTIHFERELKQGKPFYQSTFNNKYWPAKEIYDIRNLTHRGPADYETSENEERKKERINSILSSKDKNYLKYLGYLLEFVDSIDRSQQTKRHVKQWPY